MPPKKASPKRATKSTKSAPPIINQHTVDYAPTSRACCKVCGGTIRKGDIKLQRKIRSPWHDGFDLQNIDLACMSKYVSELDEISNVEILRWPDIVKIGKLFSVEFNCKEQNVASVKLIIENAWKVADIITDSKVPIQAISSLLEHNGYDNVVLGKQYHVTLIHCVADSILRGKTPLCPVCGNRSLFPMGDTLVCKGWVQDARCEFSWTLTPLGKLNRTCNLTLSETDLEKLSSRDEPFIIPRDAASAEVYRKIQKHLKSQSPFKKTLVIEGSKEDPTCDSPGAREALSDSDDESCRKFKSKVLQGLRLYAVGTLKMPRSELFELVEENGGEWVDNVKEIGGKPTVLLVPDGTVKPEAARAQTAKALGVPILRESFLTAILSDTDDPGDPDLSKTKTVKSFNRLPTGTLLRRRTYMAAYRLPGNKGLRLPKHTEITVKKEEIPLPRIKKDSAILQVDTWYAHSGDAMLGTSFFSEVYVDRLNNVWSVYLTRSDIQTGQNSCYCLQLIQRCKLSTWRLIKDKVDTHGGDENATPKVSKRHKTEPKTFSRGVEAFLKARQSHEYIDYSGISESEWASVLDWARDEGHFKYYVFKKWGRQGDDKKIRNDSTTEEFESDLSAAMKSFLFKYDQIVGASFFERFNGKKISGKYVHTELSGHEHNVKQEESASPCVDIEISDTKSALAKEVSRLIELLFDVQMLTSSLSSMGVDTSKLTLQALSSRHLQAGFSILSQLEEVIKHLTEAKQGTVERKRLELQLVGLSSKFYTLVPQQFAISQTPPPISSINEVRKKCQLLESVIGLSDSDSFRKEFIEPRYASIHQVSLECYEKLRYQIYPMEKNTEPYHMIVNLVTNTRGATHSALQFDIIDIFTLRPREALFIPSCDKQLLTKLRENSRLLWHGSRLSNWGGILRQGLRIAPPEAPVSGYMFGKGVYFADCVTKSAQYCFADTNSPGGLLILCEVLLGKSQEKLAADSNSEATLEMNGANSTLGVGQLQPVSDKFMYINSGLGSENVCQIFESADENQEGLVKVMMGPLENITKTGSNEKMPTLMYNEYIVYNTMQIVPRFLVRVEFNFINNLE